MANPQLDNGFSRVAHPISEALAKTQLSGYENRCIWALIRETYGWQEKLREIKTERWIEITGLQATHIYRTLRSLRARNMVTKNGHKYGLQKDFTRWRQVTNIGHKGGKVTRIGHKSMTKNGHKRGSSTYSNVVKDNKERGSDQKWSQKKEIPTSRHYEFPKCKECGCEQDGLRILPGTGCNRCKPELVD